MHRLSVVRSERVSPGFQRVTIGGDGLEGFASLGFDQWFRLFFPFEHQESFALPERRDSGWWPEYLALPDPLRPHCSNYTVLEYRENDHELDVDVALHVDAHGALEGRVAAWSLSARPGDPAAILDQGRLFDLPDDAENVLLVADETGLPGVVGILRDLPHEMRGHVIVEIACPDDARELIAPEGVDVEWVLRGSAPTGAAALDALERHPVDPAAYCYVVGESDLATAGRRAWVHAGVPKQRITFSGYWRRA